MPQGKIKVEDVITKTQTEDRGLMVKTFSETTDDHKCWKQQRDSH